MGSKPDDIAREIRSERQAIDRKIQALAERLRSDAQEGQSTMRERMPDLSQWEWRVRRHPMTSLVSAFGAGAVLGMVSEGFGGGGGSAEPERQRAGGRTEPRDGGGSSMFGAMLGPATGVLQRRIQTLVEDATSSFAREERRQEAQASGNGRSEDERQERAPEREREPAESRS